jgi:hypothetical protein
MRFKKEGVKLKNSLVFMEFGSVESNFEGHCSAVPKAPSGREGVSKKVVSNHVKKGTCNQGLSYFHVDFLDIIMLINKLLKSLKVS